MQKNRRSDWYSRVFPGLSLILLGLVFLSSSASSAANSELVYVATYEGVINPVAAEYINHVLTEAQEGTAAAVVIRLDTPGGLDTSMRLIIKDITSSPVPVIVYVAPSGGRAASAGVFILYAAHIAAMAPSTNVGAAHPVAMGGGEMDAVMKEKVENDAAAYIKSIAEKRGRNIKWAEEAVRKSVSVTEREALGLKVIDLIADDVPSLLAAVDGRQVITGAGKIVLHTKGALLKDLPMGWRLEALKALSDPNIAFILMTLGTIGLLAELYNPGAILPGIVGAISLILAFYSLQTLPVNYAGVLLIILGIVLFILEIKVMSYGLLSLGGLASLIFGALLLVKTDAPFLRVSLSFIIPTAVLVGTVLMTLTWIAVKTKRRHSVTGAEGMVGTIALAKTDVAPRGRVFVHGEIWEAVSDEPIREGEEARIKAVSGLTLKVAPHRK
jgi:membrane-bound serine protease (ClpP class)